MKTKDGRGIKSKFQLLLLLVVSVAGFSAAAAEFRKTTQYYDALYLASIIEPGGRVDRSTTRSAVDSFLAEGGGADCRSDIVKSGMTLLLFDLDQQNPDGDYEAWEKSVENAQSFLEHASTCLPTDGNIWLRLAMVRQLAGEQPTEMASLMARSQQFAPAEKPVLAGRFELWNRLSAETLALSTNALRSDVMVYDRFYWGEPITAMQTPSKALAASAGFAVHRPASKGNTPLAQQR